MKRLIRKNVKMSVEAYACDTCGSCPPPSTCQCYSNPTLTNSGIAYNAQLANDFANANVEIRIQG